ncbi:hypothetical protein Pyn_23422 [Prunus yedoensis var. nudiflora]|uniref:Uncharacterized protein n=1 Tax=Prunus yedoensis var. nudiflora TaxID=2094558 RepID=A0A314UQM8_PRUYE|nr:hypothetical protein Pyn_23422 [Prunus yedoensis var. nudiflora]
MVFLRLIITLVPFFILLHVTHGALSKVLASDEIGRPIPRRSPVNGEKEIYDGVPAAMDEVERTRIIGGRKMSMPEMINEEGFNNIGRERRFIRSTSNLRRRQMKVKIDGFIPLNADYHVPKPHPPKNN